MEWQPIETAPKDGTVVLIADRDGDIALADFDNERGEWWREREHWTDSHSEPIYPTHWMPLPPAPSSTQQGEGK